MTTKILLIDDEDDIREVAALTLETMGDFEVLTAGDGFTGLESAALLQPHVILLDVMMPDVDGPATLAMLREKDSTRDIPVIFMTAKVQASDRRTLSGLDVLGIIAKPFDPMTLADEVTALLNGAVNS
jgi:CheY-like chemotaxis protein